jgi:hypothetical protein
MTQAIFWIYSTISWIVFVIQKIELKSVILRCKTSMKTCYPGHTDWNTTNYSLQSLRSKSYVTRSGVSMLGISNAAEDIGLRTMGYRLSWEQLRDEVNSYSEY